jgi:hypothetical protein
MLNYQRVFNITGVLKKCRFAWMATKNTMSTIGTPACGWWLI